ncbi:shikimate kinase [Marisediminicola senii]|uniref:shikimate kinase n=1 Tax=Marisediminicola senii TaxID=2711233 RepID=UPI0013EC4DF7|nr:shikimate kinase [Marisediminicola senii]
MPDAPDTPGDAGTAAPDDSTRPYLVVIGAPGAGKTRIGKKVAKMLRVPFVDTDRRIVMRHGPIAQIFSGRGEDHFRRIERVEVAKALTERAVVSLGGGAVLDPATQADLADKRVALMTVSAEAVAMRLGQSRPLLQRGGVAAWEGLVAARRDIYERLASRSWDTSTRPIDTIAREIADWVTADCAKETAP